MESGENSSQNPGQFSQEVKLMGPVHPVVAVLIEQEKKIKGLINRVSGGELFVGTEQRDKADHEIGVSEEFGIVVNGIIGMPAFELGEAELVEIGRYLDHNFPRTDAGAVKGIAGNTLFRKNLANAIGIIYSTEDVEGITDEMLKDYVKIGPKDIISRPEIVGNREALEKITERVGPVVELVNLWNEKKGVREDVMARYKVAERFFTITGDFGNGFNQINLYASLAKRRLPSPQTPGGNK